MATELKLIIAGGPTVSLASCPIGLFVSASGELCLKTEYGNNDGRIDAYIVSSGEFFWGGATTPKEQRQVQVTYVISPDLVRQAAMKCELTIARLNGGDDNKTVRIDATDGPVLLGRIEVDLESFAAAVMGLGKVEAIFTTTRPQRHVSSSLSVQRQEKP